MSVAWVFPGQGSHSVGMASAWSDVHPVVTNVLATADQVLGRNLTGLIEAGPLEALSDTRNQQPALLATSIAILRGAAADLPPPAFVAGHSVGEFAACVAAAALTYEDALTLVEARAQLMHEAGERNPGRVAAVLGLSDAEVESICADVDGAEIANYNSPGQVVISGTIAGIEGASAYLIEAGARRVIPLNISVAVHSSLMAGAAAAFADRIAETTISAPRVPIVGNVSAMPLNSADELREELQQQLTASVRWTKSVEAMLDAGVDTFIEIGPGNVLGGLIKRIARGREIDDLIIESLANPPETA